MMHCVQTQVYCFLGNAGYSPDQVARAFSQAIGSFMGKNPAVLTQINVVVYQQNMIGAFQMALKNITPPQAQGNVFQSTSAASGVVINVTGGDILKSTCEVMVNTTGGNFDLRSKDFFLLYWELLWTNWLLVQHQENDITHI